MSTIIRNPARVIVGAYLSLILVGAGLLSLPWSAAHGRRLGFTDALFMSTSATTITGLVSVDHDRFTNVGEVVLIVLVQIGGFGIMTIGSVMAVIAARHLGLRQRLLAQAEIGAVDQGEMVALVRAIAKITIFIEGSLALILMTAFWIGGYENFGGAIYSGVFHSISAFNNAGFSLYPDSLARFAGDAFVILPLSFGFILGGLGFPVFTEVIRRRRRRLDVRAGSTRALPWSIHTKVTVAATISLVIVGPLAVMAFEWTNQRTLGSFDLGEKLLSGWLQGVTPRSAGFSVVDNAAMHETTLVVTTALMFIGAGSVSTGGGIKVTTFAVLGAVMWSEVRGERDTHVFGRRLPASMVRQALTVALLAIGVLVAATLALMTLESLPLVPSVFEVMSAFGTTGLSIGVTPTLSTLGEYLIMVLMFVGRVSAVTFVAAVALTDRARAYRLPEERLIIG